MSELQRIGIGDGELILPDESASDAAIAFAALMAIEMFEAKEPACIEYMGSVVEDGGHFEDMPC